MWGAYPDAVLPGLGVVEGGQTSTGSAVAWFRRLVSGGERKKQFTALFCVCCPSPLSSAPGAPFLASPPGPRPLPRSPRIHASSLFSLLV